MSRPHHRFTRSTTLGIDGLLALASIGICNRQHCKPVRHRAQPAELRRRPSRGDVDLEFVTIFEPTASEFHAEGVPGSGSSANVSAPLPEQMIFSDGFEGGDVSRWQSDEERWTRAAHHTPPHAVDAVR